MSDKPNLDWIDIVFYNADDPAVEVISNALDRAGIKFSQKRSEVHRYEQGALATVAMWMSISANGIAVWKFIWPHISDYVKRNNTAMIKRPISSISIGRDTEITEYLDRLQERPRPGSQDATP